MPSGSGMWARWSNTIGDGTFSRIGMISMILAAEALIWICQPRSLTRFDSGSIISDVVAPACAKLNRIPRAPSPCHAPQLGISHRGVDHADTACAPAERDDY